MRTEGTLPPGWCWQEGAALVHEGARDLARDLSRLMPIATSQRERKRVE